MVGIYRRNVILCCVVKTGIAMTCSSFPVMMMMPAFEGTESSTVMMMVHNKGGKKWHWGKGKGGSGRQG